MAKYSTETEAILKAAVTSAATWVEYESTRDIASGASSLQTRSIRRIWAFIVASLASSVPATTTTQSRSTEMVLSTALSFSIHASPESSDKARVFPASDCVQFGYVSIMRKPIHDKTTGRR